MSSGNALAVNADQVLRLAATTLLGQTRHYSSRRGSTVQVVFLGIDFVAVEYQRYRGIAGLLCFVAHCHCLDC
jgi:hypothetical protein